MSRTANPAPGFAKNPDRIVTVEPLPGTVTVRAGGTTIASSSRALTLSEPPYPPVLYIPFADIDFPSWKGPAIRRTAPTRARPPTGMWRSPAPRGIMRCGVMRLPMTKWPRSRITQPFIPTR